MLERLKDLPTGVDGVEASGTITKAEYERVLEPILDEARREGRKLRFLYQFGPDFKGFEASAAWEDAKVGLRSMRLFDGCAVVADAAWIRDVTSFAAFLMPCPVRVFSNAERTKAATWLASLPAHAGVSHRLIPQSGVLVADVHEPLRAHDFDALAATADTWIEAHGSLQGLVIHVRQFPGWENLPSLLRHVRFVRDHHRKVKRVALSSDEKLADILPKLVEHFVDAEIKTFDYEQIDAATAWAGGAVPVEEKRKKPSSTTHTN